MHSTPKHPPHMGVCVQSSASSMAMAKTKSDSKFESVFGHFLFALPVSLNAWPVGAPLWQWPAPGSLGAQLQHSRDSSQCELCTLWEFALGAFGNQRIFPGRSPPYLVNWLRGLGKGLQGYWACGVAAVLVTFGPPCWRCFQLKHHPALGLSVCRSLGPPATFPNYSSGQMVLFIISVVVAVAVIAYTLAIGLKYTHTDRQTQIYST